MTRRRSNANWSSDAAHFIVALIPHDSYAATSNISNGARRMVVTSSDIANYCYNERDKRYKQTFERAHRARQRCRSMVPSQSSMPPPQDVLTLLSTNSSSLRSPLRKIDAQPHSILRSVSIARRRWSSVWEQMSRAIDDYRCAPQWGEIPQPRSLTAPRRDRTSSSSAASGAM